MRRRRRRRRRRRSRRSRRRRMRRRRMRGMRAATCCCAAASLAPTACGRSVRSAWAGADVAQRLQDRTLPCRKVRHPLLQQKL
jgi:hypothetical protein